MIVDVRPGDCVEEMRRMGGASIDAIVTDPPYGIGFMGKAWDHDAIVEETTRRAKLGRYDPDSNRSHVGFGGSSSAGIYDLSSGGLVAFQRWTMEWAREALRVLKPGGHVLAFGGPRTFHRLACGLEDAGFEIRDCLSWLFGSGFPKSLDVSKAIDRRLGVEPTKTGERNQRFGLTADHGWNPGGPERNGTVVDTVPTSDAAKEWAGWGTALKPAWEPIVVARKPLDATVAGNVLAHGTGALNIDACRIPVDARVDDARLGGNGSWSSDKMAKNVYEGGYAGRDVGSSPLGRWPANVVLDEEAGRLLDAQTGELQSGQAAEGGHVRNAVPDGHRGIYGNGRGLWSEAQQAGGLFGDAGGASRFFYCAKAGREEREFGLDATFGLKTGQKWSEGTKNAGSFQSKGTTHEVRNHHPTVKPVSLMQWLVRLVTPPRGIVLDPFLGSGTTGIAAVLEGFGVIGIERESEYVAIARARIGAALERPVEARRVVGAAVRSRRLDEFGG
jgi:site-specific DNA-methyltransferase (adenine-specific)